MKSESLQFARSKQRTEKQMNKKNKLKNAERLLSRIRPGQLLLKYFIKPNPLTLHQVAEKLKIPTQKIIEIHKITPKLANPLAIFFNSPAHVSITWTQPYTSND